MPCSEMASGDTRTANDLPQSFGPLIGRTGEAEEILSLLTTARMFTLTGTGGSGKTRLAAQVADQSRAAFPDGVRWVDLAPISDPALAPHAVAARCGVNDRVVPNILEALVAALRPQRLLLVLDNCEHVLSECARMAKALLAACPDLHVLATSREALALPGEVTWYVAPLRIPEDDAVTAVEDLLAYESVALFVARTKEALPGFRLTAENASSVADICRQVAGLPLALELAAARLRMLSPAELAGRLSDASRVLTRGPRTAPPRQQTLRATLDWSYRLLSDGERVVFSRLAVFAGSFSLEGAERVCAGPGIAEQDVLDTLFRLVEKSLVSVHERGEETRFRLLEPLRQYARERLVERGEAEQTYKRHRDWYAELAARASMALTGPDQGRWLDRLETEHDNFRAALGWSLAHNDPATAGQIAAGIWQFWLLRGYVHEAYRSLEQTLAALAEPVALRAHLLWVAGILARPDAALAQRRFEESLAIWQALDDRDGTARTLGTLGFMAQAHGDHVRAVSFLEQSLALARSSADSLALARVLNGLGLSILNVGDIERATALCQEALNLCQREGDLRGTAAAKANLGLIWQAHGDEPRAGALWEESLAVRRSIGDLGGAAHVLTLLGNLAVKQGAYARATALFDESLALRLRTGDQDGVAPVLEGLALVGAAQGHSSSAVQLAGFAAALREATNVPQSPTERAAHDQMLTTLRERLGVDEFALAWDEGQSLSFDQVVEASATLRTVASNTDSSLTPSDRTAPPAVPSSAPASALTRRETDVLRLLTFGLTYAQIAESLFISPRTVDAHVRSIFGKLDVHSRSAATRIALQDRLV